MLNAKAAAAQATYDLQSSIGAVDAARVVLRETIGVEPSDAILVEEPAALPLPTEVTGSIENLVNVAMEQRPDLRAFSEKIQASNAEFKAAKSEYRPTVHFGAAVAQQSLWPTVNVAGPDPLGHSNETVWSVGLTARWTIFDGGLRRNEVHLADSRRREAQDEKREKEDAIGREVWVAYVQFQTAVRQHEAAETLLTSQALRMMRRLMLTGMASGEADQSVTAENQLAQARLAVVQSRSAVRIDAANLDFATGNMLRQQPPVAQPAAKTP